MQGRRVIFGVVLAASLATNAYLLHARVRKPASAPKAHAIAAAPTAIEPPVPAPAVLPKPVRAAELATVERAELEQRLQRAEADLERLLPLPEKYERDERNLESEARLRPVLDEALVGNNGEAAVYTLECHGNVCRIADGGFAEWWSAVQDATGGMFVQASYSSEGIYAELESPERVAGMRFHSKMRGALHASDEVLACRKTVPAKAHLKLFVRLEPTRRLVGVPDSGPWAEPFGVCALRATETFLARQQVPREVTWLPDWTLVIEGE